MATSGSKAEELPAFGRYQDPVMLGQGGMGAVYRAVDPSLGRYVAIKVLTHREPKYVERFRREAQVLAKIMHPSIIQIYEIVGSDEEESQDPYIVMEYFEGRPLDAAVKAGKLQAGEVASILRQAAEGLRKAHSHNVIHRDIKPANIMLARTGEVKILDFGIAKLSDAKKDLTGNTVLGTPYYMSPEQATGRPIDARSDIYSLGITAFHLLTGRRPFEAKSKVDVMLMQVKTPLPSILDSVPCDERVVGIVEKMCAKAQKDRFQDCGELIDALDLLPASLGGKRRDTGPEVAPAPRGAQWQATPARPSKKPGTRPDLRKSAPAAVSKPVSRMWLGAGAGAGGALLVLGIVAWMLTRGGSSSSGPWRVPARGWVSAGPPAPPLKRVQSAGGYGNCVFSTNELERGKEDQGAVRAVFSVGEPIFGRCYFAHQIGPNKSGEVWQELWIDGVKRAQIIYDPALPRDEDQLALEVSKRQASRLSELSAGKHTLDIWIYRQAEDSENPEPLAAGELVVRK